MNKLLSPTLTSPTGATSASRFADEARANTARAQSAKAEVSGQFSQLLRGYDKPAESPKPAGDASPAAAAAPPKAEGKTETQRQEARSAAPKKSAEPVKSTADKPAAATPAKAEASDGAATTPLETKTADDATTSKDDAASPDRVIAAMLAQAAPVPLAVPTGMVGTPGAAKSAGNEIAPDDAAQPDDGRTSATTSSSKPLGRTAHASAEAVKAEAGDSAKAGSASDFASALTDAMQAQPALLRGAEAGPRARADGGAIDGIASAGASAQAQQTALNLVNPASTDTGSTTRVTVASPLYTPGFAPEMAARLSVLAADGVQTAQLHLNPADMGPVAVQIVVEGQQARIEFQADQADTRAVLERSLPDLAAALRDSGLTLSGGGVFQQFAGQDQSGAQARNEGNTPRRGGRDMGDALSALPVRAAPLARQTQGVVDLYA